MSKKEKIIVTRAFGKKNLNEIIKKIIKSNLSETKIAITNKVWSDS
mgnify:CR=1 FL=1|jgi:hypothetical protein